MARVLVVQLFSLHVVTQHAVTQCVGAAFQGGAFGLGGQLGNALVHGACRVTAKLHVALFVL
ncbi:hypothetical protein D3C71_1698240 [compost metagenome]